MSRASVLLQLQQIGRPHRAVAFRARFGRESSCAVTQSSIACASPSRPHRRRIKDSSSTARLAELEAASLQTKIREMDRRLYGGTIRNPAELMELQRELDVLRVKLSDAEDEALGRMEEVDAAQMAMRDMSALVAAREAQRARAMEPLRARLETLTAELEAATARARRAGCSR